MELSSKLIEGFVNACLLKDYDGATSIEDFHREMWDYCCLSDSLVSIAAPRGHSKSQSITHAYTLASVLFRVRSFVVIVSDTETQAVNFLGDIKKELTLNENIIDLFEVSSLIKDTQTDIIVEFKDGTRFRIICRGAEQRVRGLKWESKRPDLIVCDDLESDEAVSSKERRTKLHRWFYGALLPCRSSNGIVRIVGTIMHMDSLLNKLMPSEIDPLTVHTPLKTYSTRKRVEWRSLKLRAHDETFSNILWPSRFSKDTLIRLKENYTEQGLADSYSQEYLNYPIDESTAFFKRGDFLEIREDVLRDIQEDKVNVNYYVGCDLAVSTADRSDYSVFVIAAVDDKGILNIVEVRKARMDSMEIIEEFFVINTIYRPEWFAMERGTIEKSIGPVLRAEMITRNNYLHFELSTANKDKTTRARGIQARIRAGGIKFDKTAGWYSDLEDEFVRFPKARHDDTVDALSWLGITFDKVITATTIEEDDEEEYLQMTKNTNNGRSLICGY